MSFSISRVCRTLSGLLVLVTLIAHVTLATFAQQPEQPGTPTDVVRISTELVQTGVLVLDKQGRFVEGLKPEHFQLRVDGKPVTPAFFEHVVAGTLNEQRMEAAVARAAAPATAASPMGASYRGRTIIFFIDDLHLSAASVNTTRKAVLEFIENQMGPEDKVAIASPSGQIGFLQQFTDVKPVLRAAIGRLSHRDFSFRDAENITMTEYTALRIDQGDKEASSYYVQQILKATSFPAPPGGIGPPRGGPAGQSAPPQNTRAGMPKEMAERQVKERALVLLRQAAAITVNTLSTLESLMRSSAQLPGRKLVFFISDGFYLDDRNTGFGDKLKQITDAAVRAGVVIYAMDARGMVSMTDAGSNRADIDGRLSRSNVGEISASQDPLNALAADTGGRANFNTGALTPAVTNALKETSNYYLLAWRPPAEETNGSDFKRIEVSIVNRPDLSVRLPRGFLHERPKGTAKDQEAKNSTPENSQLTAAADKSTGAVLVRALSASSAREGLPTQLSTSFLDVPNSGPVLTASVQMATDVLGYGPDGKQSAAIDVAGVILNDLGKQAGSFKNRVTVNPSPQAATGQNPGVIYNHKIPLKPGIYQVRVAAVDNKSGRVGSAAKWIEIPDLASKKLTLSTLLVGGQFVGANQQPTSGGSADQMQFSVDRRFARGSRLSVLTIIYNAARSAGAAVPDLEAQIRIFRGGQPIISSPVRKLNLEVGGDVARIPYGADIKLNTLTPGRYLLRIDINDRVANTNASQETVFEVE